MGGGYHGGGQLGKFYHAAMYTPPEPKIQVYNALDEVFDVDAGQLTNKPKYMRELGSSDYTKNVADALRDDAAKTRRFKKLFTDTATEREAINKALSAEAAKDLKPGFLISEGLHADTVKLRPLQRLKELAKPLKPGFLISEGLHADTVKLRPLQMSKELYPGQTIPMQLETTALEKQAAKYAAEEAAYLRGGLMSRFAGSSVGAAVGVAAATAVMDYFMGSDDEEGEGGE